MQSRLVEYDLLGIYGNWESVAASAARIGTRFRRDNPFTAIGGELESVRAGFFALPKGPGLGIDIADTALEKHRIG